MIARERVYRTADGRLVPEDHPEVAFLVCTAGEKLPIEYEAAYMGEKPSESFTSNPAATHDAKPEPAPAALESSVTAKLELPSRSGSREAWAEVAVELGIDPGEMKRNEIIALVDAHGVK